MSFVLDDEVVFSHEVIRVHGVAALAHGVQLLLHAFERLLVGAFISSQEVLCFGGQLNVQVETYVEEDHVVEVLGGQFFCGRREFKYFPNQRHNGFVLQNLLLDEVLDQDAQLQDLVVNELFCDRPHGDQSQWAVVDQLERVMPVESDVVCDGFFDLIQFFHEGRGEGFDVVDGLCFLLVNFLQVYERVDDQLDNFALYDEDMSAVFQHL